MKNFKILVFAIAIIILAAGCGEPASNGGKESDASRRTAASGTGTPNTRWYSKNPKAARFTISTADELAGLAQIVNGTWGGTPERYGFSGKVIKLKKNIDLSKYNNWIPVGYEAENSYYNDRVWNLFAGTFDGGGHIIKNLTIDRPGASYQGLFGNITGSTVKNLGLEGININGGNRAGGIAGSIFKNSSVINCYSTGTISGGDAVGGLVGGIVGNSGVANSYSAVAVRGATKVGGVVGEITAGSINSCYSTGAVSGYDIAGGVAGVIRECVGITNCAALNPEVKGDCAGRIVGYIAFMDKLLGSITDDAGIKNNIAYTAMKNKAKDTVWHKSVMNGEDITFAAIKAGQTMNSRFVTQNGWITVKGKLPGLVSAVEPPAYFTTLISDITISPAYALAGKGLTRQYSVAVEGVSADKTVKWAVSGNTSGGTAISAAGLLTVAADETADALTVTATAAADKSVSAAAVIKTANTDWYTGAIAADPSAKHFTVSSADELALLSHIANGTWGGTPQKDDFAGKTVNLAPNIDLSPYYDLLSTQSNEFAGTFEGEVHTISDYPVNMPVELIRFLNNHTIFPVNRSRAGPLDYKRKGVIPDSVQIKDLRFRALQFYKFKNINLNEYPDTVDLSEVIEPSGFWCVLAMAHNKPLYEFGLDNKNGKMEFSGTQYGNDPNYDFGSDPVWGPILRAYPESTGIYPILFGFGEPPIYYPNDFLYFQQLGPRKIYYTGWRGPGVTIAKFGAMFPSSIETLDDSKVLVEYLKKHDIVKKRKKNGMSAKERYELMKAERIKQDSANGITGGNKEEDRFITGVEASDIFSNEKLEKRRKDREEAIKKIRKSSVS